MSNFLFPRKCCRELDGLISDFWWGQNEQSGKKIHWKNWKQMTAAKEDGGMGFRYFQAFNEALLAKTAWRILQNPQELWCKILKGIYFPKCNFMEAGKGCKASWGWVSIMEGRELLRKQLFWKVGNGKEINVWEDRWISELNDGKLEYTPGDCTEKRLKVAELIQNGRWELSKIEGKITELEKHKILQIRIVPEDRSDEAIWLKNKDGKYSVKSGYQIAKLDGRKEGNMNPSSSYQISKQFWRCIWKLHVPPKIKHFMWRMLNNALATKQILHKRKCARDGLCPVCGIEEETVEHMILLCPWARKCWFGCSLTLQIQNDQITSIRKWCEELLLKNKEVTEDGKALVAAVCWGIWKGRCDWVFKENMVDAQKVVDLASMLVKEVWRARGGDVGRGGRRRQGKVERNLMWKAPDEGLIKINADGAFLDHTKQAGVGIVCRNDAGLFLGGMGKKVEANSAFEAECLAVKEALMACSRFGRRKCCIEMDCEELFKCLSTKSVAGVEWKSAPILKELIQVTKDRPEVEFSLVARQGNAAADYLAAMGSRGWEPNGWLETAPSPLVTILMADLVAGRMKEDAGADQNNRNAEATGIG